MWDGILTIGLIFGFFLLWDKIPLLVGYMLNLIGKIPDISSNMSIKEQNLFLDEKNKYEKEAMPQIYGFSQSFGRG